MVNPDGTPNYDKIEENRKKDLENNLMMQELQRRTNSQNAMLQAVTTLMKGSDDVMRQIASNLK